MPNISIIMPLFNAEKYLSEALQSVLNQTYRDFELICIDDCSTDRTRSIVEKFQKKDGRIRILINEERLGAAPSRNRGLKAAEGEYIVFLDGDDVFEEELLITAGSAMETYQADLVLFEYLHVPSEKVYVKKWIERPENFRDIYCKKPFSMEMFPPREFPWWAASPCNKMFRKSFLIKEKLEFQDLPSCNDVYFAQMALFCAKRIICLDDRRVMVYARDHGEPQRISNRRNPLCSYYAMENLCRELQGRGLLGKYASYLFYRLPAYFRYVLMMQKDEEQKRYFYNFLHEEGIPQCVEYGKEYYEQIDAYDRYLLESFQDQAYESRWFENLDTYFQFYLKKNGSVVCEFIKAEIAENKKIVLWGAGVNGKIFLSYLAEHSVSLWRIVDRDPAKQGTFVNGYEITVPSDFLQEADYILVTSKEVFQEVSGVVKELKAIVINLLEMLTERKRDS